MEKRQSNPLTAGRLEEPGLTDSGDRYPANQTRLPRAGSQSPA